MSLNHLTVPSFEEAKKLKAMAVRDSNPNYDPFYVDEKIWSEGVVARNLCYAIKSVDILNNVDLNLPRGQVYGLLGPSGCGKTTLLRCFIGSIVPQVGDLFIFGHRPYDLQLGIPGPKVGYMPQEVALHCNLTVYENLIYFGIINRVPTSQLIDRSKTMIEMFGLTPYKHFLISQLSGGQARRVSLLVALIHEPPLIILDEPTVGVDPILRETCWNHLIKLTQVTGCTIIISTHYIEEAKRAHRIGFMRKGRIIVEDEPNRLMTIHSTTSLEKVFLNLCAVKRKSTLVNPRDLIIFQQRMARAGKNITLGHDPRKGCFLFFGLSSDPADQTASKSSQLFLWFILLIRLTWNNIRNECREPLILSCQYFVSFWVILLFYFGIGNAPHDLQVAVVNEDTSLFSLVPAFIDSLNGSTFIPIPYASLDQAMEDARTIPFWGVLRIPENFTSSLLLDRSSPSVTVESIRGAQMELSVDMANALVASMGLRTFFNGFLSFMTSTQKMAGMDERSFSLPIQIAEPIYGHSVNRDYNDFRRSMFPGFVINVTLSLSMAVSSIGLIQLKRSNTFERLLVSGLTRETLIFVHCLTRITLTLPYVLIVTCLQYWLIGVDYPSELGTVSLVFALQVSIGIVTGILLAGLCKEVVASLYAVSGLFVILLVSSGSLWPIESISTSFRWICYCLPGTGSVEAYRSSIYRDWSLIHSNLWPGFMVDMVWLIGLTLIGLKIYR